jgi:hypothetical protein
MRKGCTMASRVVTVNVADVDNPKPSSLAHLGGSKVGAFNARLLNELVACLSLPASITDEDRRERVTAMTAALKGFKPADEIEGMLAAQAVAMHAAGMHCMRLAMLPDQPFEWQERMQRSGARMFGGFAAMVDALEKKRGRGQQSIRVEHVTVNAGGQAIVGAVTPGLRPGGGSDGREQAEPHTPAAGLAHDAAACPVGTALRGEDEARAGVPISRDGKRPVPHARRRQHRA